MNASTRLAALLALTALALPAAAAGVILDANGCRFLNPSPRPDERITWTGGCVDGWGEGQGTLQWIVAGETGTTYVGMLAKGRPDGQGTITWKNGDRYEGRFDEGLRPGPGAFTSAQGLRVESRFERNGMNGPGAVTLADGSRLEGRFHAGMLLDGGLLVRHGPAGEQRLPVDVAEPSLPDVPPLAASAPGRPTLNVDRRCGPQYPPVAIRQHATGRTRMALLVDPDGSVRRVRIVAPSGLDLAHQVLDLTAITAILGCALTPGTLDGQPAARWLPVEYLWKLE
jgi:TonB family protein